MQQTSLELIFFHASYMLKVAYLPTMQELQNNPISLLLRHQVRSSVIAVSFQELYCFLWPKVQSCSWQRHLLLLMEYPSHGCFCLGEKNLGSQMILYKAT
jgi:hypothetical protein